MHFGISRKENRSAPSRARGARERGGPTATGFAPVCVESYAANASVAVYQCAVGPAARLVRDNIRSARVWRRLHLQAAQPMPRAGADATNGQCDGCRRDCHRRHLSQHRPESALESAAIRSKKGGRPSHISTPGATGRSGISFFKVQGVNDSFMIGLLRRTMRQSTGAQGPDRPHAETS